MYFYAATFVTILIAPHRVVPLLLAALAIVVVFDLFGIPLRFYSDPLVLEFGLGVLVAVVVRYKLSIALSRSRPQALRYVSSLSAGI